jgi:hypothetical protein
VNEFSTKEKAGAMPAFLAGSLSSVAKAISLSFSCCGRTSGSLLLQSQSPPPGAIQFHFTRNQFDYGVLSVKRKNAVVGGIINWLVDSYIGMMIYYRVYIP